MYLQKHIHTSLSTNMLFYFFESEEEIK